MLNETYQSLKNIGAILDAANCNFTHVVRTTIMLANISDFARVNQIYETSLKDFINQQELINLITASNTSMNELKSALVKSPRFMDPTISADKIKTEYNELNNVKKIFIFIYLYLLFYIFLFISFILFRN